MKKIFILAALAITCLSTQASANEKLKVTYKYNSKAVSAVKATKGVFLSLLGAFVTKKYISKDDDLYKLAIAGGVLELLYAGVNGGVATTEGIKIVDSKQALKEFYKIKNVIRASHRSRVVFGNNEATEIVNLVECGECSYFAKVEKLDSYLKTIEVKTKELVNGIKEDYIDDEVLLTQIIKSDNTEKYINDSLKDEQSQMNKNIFEFLFALSLSEKYRDRFGYNIRAKERASEEQRNSNK